jgi:hypothetical protein
MRHTCIAIAVLIAASSARAAVTFPPEAGWTPFQCGGQPMTDPYADDAQYLLDLDLVGDPNNAAGYHASDATNLYLRIRLDADPTMGGVPKATAWGYEFDLDNDPSTYELLINVDGIGGGGGMVAVYANTQTTIPNSPTDPATGPALATFPFAMNARVIQAPGSAFGGTADFFLEFAVPWSTLVAHGIDHTTSVHVWAGSSATSTNLDGDIACEDGATGAATLDGAASTATPADPGGGGGPGGPGELVGGEHCQVGGGGGLVLLFAVAFLLRRRR